jgi:hypothetical protein
MIQSNNKSGKLLPTRRNNTIFCCLFYGEGLISPRRKAIKNRFAEESREFLGNEIYARVVNETINSRMNGRVQLRENYFSVPA